MLGNLMKMRLKWRMISLTTELTPKTLLACGILERYHDTSFEDYYGHPKKWQELEPLIKQWNDYYYTEPQKHINLNFEEGNELLSKIGRYVTHLENARRKGISIMLSGSNGTGKSLLATCILKEAIKRGFSGQMTSLGGIIQLYTDGWGDPIKRQKFDSRIRNTDFLLIDDVGKEYQAKNSDLTEIMFDNLIRYRVGRNKPFILTTNTGPEDLLSRYGTSLMSLIHGNCLKLRVVDNDYRKLIQRNSLWGELETP